MTTNNSINSPSLGNIAAANNSALITDGSGIGSLSQTLPAAVQGNITTLGSVSSGSIGTSVTGVVHTTTNENIGGTKTFTSPTLMLEVQNPFYSNATPTDLTATTATISAAQLLGGILTLNPTLAATYTLPNATDIEAIAGNVSSNRGFWVTMVNQSAVLVTLSAGTNTNLNGAYLTAAVVSIPGSSSRIFRVVKIDNTPTYALFG